jgi:hypothetical protein
MSRKIIALGALAFAGALLVVPDPSSARAGGGMHGGFHGVRGPVFIARHGRANFLHPRLLPKPFQFQQPVVRNRPHNLLARTTVRAPFVHLARRSHGAYVYGSSYPITGNDEAAYFGMPYDPGAAIPVYGPAPFIQDLDPPPPPRVPRLSGMRDENREACSAEVVTVPADQGDREIRVVRC